MPIIGIDLGTTNSLVAYWNEGGPVIIPNVLGSNLTPSVVSVDENGELLLGQIAKERLITHPNLTAAVFKRYMGTEKKYNLGKHYFAPEELSSFVIRSLKADAEAFLNQEVTEAIISVPAYFNDAQRKATKRAGEIAGLKVERLISEPTAAAIAYGMHQAETDTKFLIFDLGGGTFDVSILELFEGVMEVKSVAGDNFLGGEDFTEAIISHFCGQHQLNFQALDLKERNGLYKQAENCKYDLTKGNEAKLSVLIGSLLRETVIDRACFEKLVHPLLLRLRHPIERVLHDASLTPDELDAVILIGGATRMPIVRTVVTKMFGRLPFSNINPDEAVALGAGIQGALKERNEALNEVILTDVCPYSLGTAVVQHIGNVRESGYFLPIIERNTPIPVSRVERVTTAGDNQTAIKVEIYQGESRKVENNIKLGEMEITVPPAPAGEQPIDIRYTYDINGILEVEVCVLETGEKKRVVIEKNPGTMTEAEIEARLQMLKDIKIHPRERTENRLLLARGERLYEESLGEEREYVARLLARFEAVLLSQDDRNVKKLAAELKAALDELERRSHF
ncbi:MAG TPA: molecular chaperone HscC [Bacillota bacterium]|nr:molecular chaperone HscC [Bacillota bacterium]